MIYLIGGAPRVGKSIIAKAFAEELGARFVSTDDLEKVVVNRTPKKELTERFPLSGFSFDPLKNTLSPDERARLQIISARSIENEIDHVVQEADSSSQPLILEGVHLLPDYVNKLIQKFGAAHIRVVFIGATNKELALEGIERNSSPDDWLQEAGQAVREQVAEFVVSYSNYIRSQVMEYGLAWIERTNDFRYDKERTTEALMRS